MIIVQMEGLFLNLLQNIKEISLAPHRDPGGHKLCGKANTEKVRPRDRFERKDAARTAQHAFH